MVPSADRPNASDSGVAEDVGLLRRVGERDEAAFARLYDRFARPLYSVALHVVRDPITAEEVLQEVFLRIWDTAGQYDAGCGKPLTWAVVLTRNKAIDRLRANDRRRRLAEAYEARGDAPAAVTVETGSRALGEREEAALLRRALDDLPAEQRAPIELAFLSGYTQTEIASQLQLPLGTVKARIRRGMLQLRARLERGTLDTESMAPEMA
ncbi:MAG: sigma-70 family RNA polymerase sigma factor [Verrucomicrobiae bacterium]|nr:sigma-70 family RNA polymerase sigma factor [Verrucomicrobiae bacterium]